MCRARAEADGRGKLDLVIGGEAPRTTGAYPDTDAQSMFTKFHLDEYVNTAKRLYMTATPRVYGDQAKAKAADADVLVASMDDESTFGPVFHELRFGDAVAQRLLTDYKAVSYTHLRAHETVLDLVCRLLLEKKKTVKQKSLVRLCEQYTRNMLVDIM